MSRGNIHIHLWKWLLGATLFSLLGGQSRVLAQPLLGAEVRVELSALPQGQAEQLSSLQEQIAQMLQSYAPRIETKLMPRHPIRTIVSLRLTGGDGFRYVGDLEIVMMRPIYGRDTESVILMATEKDVEFEWSSSPSSSTTGLGSTIPQNLLLRRIFYYATLGTMYYYDSFAPLGGAGFLQYMLKEKIRLEEPWNKTSVVASSSYLSPQIHLKELESTWGSSFREYWYLYHLEALDDEDTDNYAEVLIIVLTGLKNLQTENPSLHFAQLFSDTKAIEMQQLLSKTSPKRKRDLQELIQPLFPTIHLEL